MTLTTRIHCVTNREPAAYHSDLCYAVNLNLECEGDIQDEQAAKDAFGMFLDTLPKVEFWVFELTGSGDQRQATRKSKLAVLPVSATSPDPLKNWLSDKAPDPTEFYWTLPPDVRTILDDPGRAIDISQIRATHLLRGSHAWSAPIAHRLGLTRLLAVAPGDADVTDGKSEFIILPLASEQAPEKLPTTRSTSNQDLWEVTYRFDEKAGEQNNGALGDIVCRANRLNPVEPSLPRFLAPDGYLVVNTDAENVRRLLDWFEQSWAGLLSGLPAELAFDDPKCFKPTWAAPVNESVTLDASDAAWRILAGLTTALDPIVVALLRPQSGNAAGELLLPLVNDILDAAQDVPIAKLNLTGDTVLNAIRQGIARSPLFPGKLQIKEYVEALRQIHGIERTSDAANVPLYLCNMLLDAASQPGGASKITLALKDARPLALRADENGNLEGFRGDPYQIVIEATHRLHDETGAEDAVLRLFRCAEWEQSFPQLIWGNLGVQDDGSDAIQGFHAGVWSAWDAFVTRLKGPFNGEEAARRSASADFLEALLIGARSDTPSTGELAPPTAERLKTELESTDLFVRRCFNPQSASTFSTIVDKLPKWPTGLSDEMTKFVTGRLEQAYKNMLKPLDRWTDTAPVFKSDDAPAPLPIQISALIAGTEMDEFSKGFNGICVALRRIDDPGKAESSNWAYANLAEFKLHDGTDSVIGLRQWIPAIHDQRAPMFILYEGYPFSSRTVGRVTAPPTALPAAQDEPKWLAPTPFYVSDEVDFDQTKGGWTPVPKLVYGRRFEAFSFATTSSGSVPEALQDSSQEPWRPKAGPATPVKERRTQARCQRRTAVGATAIVEPGAAPGAGRIAAAIEDVHPLSADYPRLALASVVGVAQSIDLLRESDGDGALAFPAPDSAREALWVDLADCVWTGAQAANLTVEYHDKASLTDDNIQPVRFLFKNVQPQLPDDTHIDIGFALTKDGQFRVRIGLIESTENNPRRDSTSWWIRLTLESGGTTCLSFADPRGAARQQKQGPPLLLMTPSTDSSKWTNQAKLIALQTKIALPRVSFVDFERWFANPDLRAHTFKLPSEKESALLLDALLLAYLRRNEARKGPPQHALGLISAFLDRLPDPAVDTLLVELVRIDGIGQPVGTAFSEPLDIRKKIDEWAAKATAGLKTIDAIDGDFLEEHFFSTLTPDDWFRLEIRSDGPDLELLRPEDSKLVAKVPAGVVAELRVSPLVLKERFQDGTEHPAVFYPGMRQLAREYGTDWLIFPGDVLRIETMTDNLDTLSSSVRTMLDENVSCVPNASARQYSLVSGGNARKALDKWRLVSEISVATQRWRPGGRPIYTMIDPKTVRDGPSGAAALPVRKDADVASFEQEIFADRQASEVETVWQRLAPQAPRVERQGYEPASAMGQTVLQTFPLESPAATYLRHRYQIKTRYAGALGQGCTRTLSGWDGRKEPQDWNQRVIMLADRKRVLITRPQLRALIPLTQSPHHGGTPPIIAFLQEAPFAEGGLADRIASELKLGFGFGFDAPSTGLPDQVRILDARKEIGPDPRLTYKRMPDDYASTPNGKVRDVILAAEGPIGLTFDSTEATASAFAFANTMVSLTLQSVAGEAPPATFEEHFLGIAMRRYLDPAWLTDANDAGTEWPGSECRWIDFEKAYSGKQALIMYEKIKPLLRFDDATRQLQVSVGEIDSASVSSDPNRNWIDIAYVPEQIQRLAMLHVPITPGRYSASVFFERIKPDIGFGQTNQPVMLASFEWSPVDASPPAQSAREVSLWTTARTTLRCVASAPTFLAWSRTSRDFNMVTVSPRAGALDGTSVEAKRIVMLEDTENGKQQPPHLQFRASDERNAVYRVTPRSSTFASPVPIHVHRHLAVIGTRLAPGLGKPLEVFSGSVMLGPLAAEVPQLNDLQSATHIRLVEFESPASILSAAFHLDANDKFGGANSIPTPYKTTYVDFMATGASWDRAFRILIRFVGPQSHLQKIDRIGVRLEHPDKIPPAEKDASPPVVFVVPMQTDGKDRAVACELLLRPKPKRDRDSKKIVIAAFLVPANGVRWKVPKTYEFDGTENSFLLSLAAPDGPEFWTDVSVLHFDAASGHAIADEQPVALDFDLLFSITDPSRDDVVSPAEAVQARRLTQMREVQARLVSVSPPIAVARAPEK
ncbi:UNVERIFIED_ORG: hypothetical protein ABIC62_006130 [Burkholderia sp. 1595]|uniref:Uncharacterized protein n=1 Tax=Paraburkholderia terricola TaxID=169427 RepID=A0ABU1M1G4_9BURK|nr:hypothetical protein [Paraburkholderia terricola]MDR6412772.1 hypothetical protein [Paraburkholderia terricola]